MPAPATEIMARSLASLAGLYALRFLAIAFSLIAGTGAFILFLQFGSVDGIDALDVTRAVLILISTQWLALGATVALIGLTSRARPPKYDPKAPIKGRTVVLVPLYNEDPLVTFARIAAMDASLATTPYAGLFHFAILSDTRDDTIAAR